MSQFDGIYGLCPIPLSFSLSSALLTDPRPTAASNTSRSHAVYSFRVLRDKQRHVAYQGNCTKLNCVSYRVQHCDAKGKLGRTSQSIKHFPFVAPRCGPKHRRFRVRSSPSGTFVVMSWELRGALAFGCSSLTLYVPRQSKCCQVLLLLIKCWV